MTVRRAETDVLVVGAGPTGISAALFLARLGVDAITITKYPGHALSPRAHITNQRTMEVFRDQGVEEALMAVAMSHHLMGNISCLTSFSKRQIVSFRGWGTSPERNADHERASQVSHCSIPQHLLEPIVAEAAIGAGADVRYSHELTGLSQTNDRVVAQVTRRDTGEELEIVAKYLLGADGGNSLVAEQCGLTLDGQAGLGRAATAWFEADLSQYVEERPSVIYWMVDPGTKEWLGAGTYICIKPWTEWMMMFVYDPAEGEPDLADGTMIARVRRHVGDESLPVAIKDVTKWTVNSLIAPRYQAGRVFIGGDAAHRHPPTNGLGSNTSVQDAYNLCWKLAYVLKGIADPALLDTYEQERQPVGAQVVTRATRSMRDMKPLMRSQFAGSDAGLEPQQALDQIFENSAKGRARRQNLMEGLHHQHWHFNCHGVEIDQFYRSAAIVPDEMPRPEPERDPELYYQPSTAPGSRLPHVWLYDVDGKRVSTHDLVGHGAFTVIAGIDGDGWESAAAAVSGKLGLPLQVVRIGLGQSYSDVYGDWAELSEIGEDGALLIRPDIHIAWRSIAANDDPADALLAATRAALGFRAPAG